MNRLHRLHLVPLAALLGALSFVPAASAKGCLKGAAVGGVAGHVAGHHGLAGAAVGCAVGHHREKQKQAQTGATGMSGTPGSNADRHGGGVPVRDRDR